MSPSRASVTAAVASGSCFAQSMLTAGPEGVAKSVMAHYPPAVKGLRHCGSGIRLLLCPIDVDSGARRGQKGGQKGPGQLPSQMPLGARFGKVALEQRTGGQAWLSADAVARRKEKISMISVHWLLAETVAGQKKEIIMTSWSRRMAEAVTRRKEETVLT
jgi:hypothetical protein